jgi:hypothetical protein
MLDAWLASNAGNQATFVINLVASASPQALVKQNIPELAQFSFFISRRVEDGRERFRLHWGPFTTRAQADHHLASVRKIYPAAWIVEHPAKPRVRQTPSTPPPPPVELRRDVPRKELQRKDEPREAHEPREAGPPQEETKPAPVIEPRPPAGPVSVDVALPVASTWVSFVIELRASKAPIDIETLPPIPKFEGRVTYQVTIQREGERYHALRLGFFDDLVAARRAAQQLRQICPTAEIVAVTPAEWIRARPPQTQPNAESSPQEPVVAARRGRLSQLFGRRLQRS